MGRDPVKKFILFRPWSRSFQFYYMSVPVYASLVFRLKITWNETLDHLLFFYSSIFGRYRSIVVYQCASPLVSVLTRTTLKNVLFENFSHASNSPFVIWSVPYRVQEIAVVTKHFTLYRSPSTALLVITVTYFHTF